LHIIILKTGYSESINAVFPLFCSL